MSGGKLGAASSNRMSIAYALATIETLRQAPMHASEVDLVNENLSPGGDFATSSTARSDRQTGGSVRTSVNAGGSVNVEVGYETHDPFYLLGLGSRAFKMYPTSANFGQAATANATDLGPLRFTPQNDGTNRVLIEARAAAPANTLASIVQKTTAGALFVIDGIPDDEKVSWMNGLWRVESDQSGAATADEVMATPHNLPQGCHNFTYGALFTDTVSTTVRVMRYTRDTTFGSSGVVIAPNPVFAGINPKSVIVDIAGATGDALADQVRVGEWFRLRGVLAGANQSDIYNTFYRVIAIARGGGTDTITAAAILPELTDLTGAPAGYPTTASQTAITKQTGFYADNGICHDPVILRKQFQDITADGEPTMIGGISNGFTVNIADGSFITAEFPFLGRGFIQATAHGSDTTSPIPVQSKFSPTSGIVGAAFSTITRCFNSLTLQVTAGTTASSCAGRETAYSVGQNTMTVSGTINAKFAGDMAIFRRFLSDGDSPISFFMTNAGGSVLGFDMPKCRNTSENLNHGGQDTDVDEEFAFTAEPGTVDTNLNGLLSKSITIRMWRFPNSTN